MGFSPSFKVCGRTRGVWTLPRLWVEAGYDLTSGARPLGRLGSLEDVMGAVVFLASPAAALITGTALVVDGGWNAW